MVRLKRITERITVILWKSALRYSSRFHTQSSVFVHEHSKRRNQRNNAFHVEKMNPPMSAAVLLLTRSTINVFFIYTINMVFMLVHMFQEKKRFPVSY
ncbi:MAG: hypothetical protein C6W58_08070 [Bacillaceae bacterium]|nr:MAG: hypothetical protein C6W58_08070 [Bacillaceae bacterium]